MKYKVKGIAIIVCMLLLLLIQGLKAQPDTLRKTSIGKHVFTPATHSKLPFTGSFFSTSTGLGQTKDLVSQLGNLPVRGLEGEVLFFDMGLAYQQRVRDWLAAYIHINISARVGTELQSILTQGVNTISSFNIGWHIRLLEGEKYILSGTVELQNHTGSFVNVLGFIQDILNNHPNPSLNETIPVLSGSTGLRYALGINETLGFKASGNLAYGETYNRGENGFAFDGRIGIDLDFYPRYSFPVGLLINFGITSMPEFVYIKGERSQIAQMKIAYTKARDFSLGVEIAYLKFPFLNQEKPVTVQSVALAARYYF